MKYWIKSWICCLLVILMSFCLVGCSSDEAKGGSSAETQLPAETMLTETESVTQEVVETESEETLAVSETEREDDTSSEDGSEDRWASDLTVTFLDVEQGNSILVQTDGHAMIIDGGPNTRSSFVVAYLKEQGITNLDYMVVSHYDADHISGLVGVLNVFGVDTVLNPEGDTDTKIYQSYVNMLDKNGAEVICPEAGAEYSLGDATFQIIYSEKEVFESDNNRSLGVRIVNGENEFLILGDMEFEAEYALLDEDWNMNADVYMVSHHGSSSSSSERLLEAVSPDMVVISCGEGNSYGHPHKEVMERMEDHGYELYRTDLQGTIVAHSDGTEIVFEQDPCTDYRSGDEETYDENAIIGTTAAENESARGDAETQGQPSWIGNVNSKKLHQASCHQLPKEENREYFYHKEEALDQGYVLAKCCN